MARIAGNSFNRAPTYDVPTMEDAETAELNLQDRRWFRVRDEHLFWYHRDIIEAHYLGELRHVNGVHMEGQDALRAAWAMVTQDGQHDRVITDFAASRYSKQQQHAALFQHLVHSGQTPRINEIECADFTNPDSGEPDVALTRFIEHQTYGRDWSAQRTQALNIYFETLASVRRIDALWLEKAYTLLGQCHVYPIYSKDAERMVAGIKAFFTSDPEILRASRMCVTATGGLEGYDDWML
jgi:hypothetical protein